VLEITLLRPYLVRQHVEIVGVEKAPNVLVGQESGMRRIARLLEPVGLGRDDRVDEAELVDEENPASRARHARELGDDELRSACVVEHAHTADDVERAVLERQRRRVADAELAVGRSELPAGGDEVGREIDADDAINERSERKGKSSRPAAAVEGALGTGEWGEQLPHTVPERRSAFLLHCHAISDHVTHRRPHAPIGWPARRSRRRSRRGWCLKPSHVPRSGHRRRST